MSQLSSNDRIRLDPPEYKFLIHVVDVVGSCQPDFQLPEASPEEMAEITYEQSSAVIDLITAAIELDEVFNEMVDEQLHARSTMPPEKCAWLNQRNDTLKQREALGRTMLKSITICTAFLDLYIPKPPTAQ